MGDFKILENLEKSVTKIWKPLPIWNILDLGTGKNDLSYKNEITDKKRRMATQKKQMEDRTVDSRAMQRSCLSKAGGAFQSSLKT